MVDRAITKISYLGFYLVEIFDGNEIRYYLLCVVGSDIPFSMRRWCLKLEYLDSFSFVVVGVKLLLFVTFANK